MCANCAYSVFLDRKRNYNLRLCVYRHRLLPILPALRFPREPYWRGFFIRIMTEPARLALFIDYQNVYRRAREAFRIDSQPHFVGQINPLKVGRLIASRSDRPARLTSVRVYRGEPSGHKDARAYAACRKQADAWRRLDPCVSVETRPLRYPPDYPSSQPREKGIDVKIAIDFVDAAISKSADILVLFSGDTDLIPAVEMVFQRYTSLGVKASSAAWNGGPSIRLDFPGFWCYRLSRKDFDTVRDDVDYA